MNKTVTTAVSTKKLSTTNSEFSYFTTPSAAFLKNIAKFGIDFAKFTSYQI